MVQAQRSDLRVVFPLLHTNPVQPVYRTSDYMSSPRPRPPLPFAVTDVLGARTGLWGKPVARIRISRQFGFTMADALRDVKQRQIAQEAPPQQAPMAKFGPPNFERRTADKIGSARRGRVICRGDVPKSRVGVSLIGRHTSSFAVFRLVLWRWPCLNLGDQKEGTRRGGCPGA